MFIAMNAACSSSAVTRASMAVGEADRLRRISLHLPRALNLQTGIPRA